ncbi:Xanthine/uracil/thiamine/ascorbate permease family protein, partial [Neisseria meningitidis serogroup B]
VLFARKPAASRIGLSGLGGMFFKMLQFRTVCGRRIQIFPLDTDFQIWTLQNKHCWTGFLS